MISYLPERLRARPTSSEYLLVPLRECAPPGVLHDADSPEKLYAYASKHLRTGPCFRPESENLWVVFLNTRRRIIGHQHVSVGTIDTILVSPPSVLRAAIVANAAAVAMVHNHPSGSPSPSEADIRVTRDLVRAGQAVKIELVDHLVLGHPAEGRGFVSLREMGYLHS